MAYGSSAWMFTDSMRKKINGVNSKMLAQITRRTFHDEAKTPSFDTVDHILDAGNTSDIFCDWMMNAPSRNL